MKSIYVIILLMFSSAAMAQTIGVIPGDSNGGGGNNVPDYILGLNNGCNDGMLEPAEAAHYAYQSIMYNPYISVEYKEAYDLGWSQCFNTVGDPVDGGLSDDAAGCLFDGNCPEPPPAGPQP